MLKSYKYRIYPNKDQEILIQKHFGCVRWIWNWALAERILLWKTENKRTGKYDQFYKLPELKKKEETKWLNEVSAQALQQPLFDLNTAFIRFFKDQSNYPVFKKKKTKNSYRLSQFVAVSWKDKKVFIPKIGKVKCVFSKTFEGKIKTTTVSQTSSGKYYVSILVDDGLNIPLAQSFTEETTVGLDLGISTFATLSDGTKINNPRMLKKFQKRLAREQRSLSRKKKDSKNREKQRIKVALVHEKISNQRNDFQHKLSTKLISENQAVCLEDLNVAGMVKNKNLAKHVSDASWSEFIKQLEYKSLWYGKNILKIGRFDPSSKLCTCGIINKDLTLKDRIWVCKHCGIEHDRDILAANNIKQMALSQL